jgi:hypothetical protein
MYHRLILIKKKLSENNVIKTPFRSFMAYYVHLVLYKAAKIIL